ncbi:NfeD family protein [Conexibacter sp. W3-3-2]|uniref:NfeD family protein n=1 Tax=Paraconexibacter algicola TaxID=2133960 RepID=A0A2T4UD18_9ACTN|nr:MULTISPECIES: NfeD family protein [Solirubrobacterales]MTD43463.1 NfeD family protein [Conexibacter sp. W3-3-2]PTL55401.1 NfeD family protein [Paraconexibacter algicola]
MDDWVVWIIIAVALSVGEILNMSFFLAPFAVGALAAALASVVGLSLVPALAVFLVVSGVAFGGLRPIAKRHLRTPPQIRTGTAALIGKSAVVVERIENHEGVGAIRLDGEIWTARGFEEDVVIEAGTRVQVLEIRGATALVSE